MKKTRVYKYEILNNKIAQCMSKIDRTDLLLEKNTLVAENFADTFRLTKNETETIRQMVVKNRNVIHEIDIHIQVHKND